MTIFGFCCHLGDKNNDAQESRNRRVILEDDVRSRPPTQLPLHRSLADALETMGRDTLISQDVISHKIKQIGAYENQIALHQRDLRDLHAFVLSMTQDNTLLEQQIHNLQLAANANNACNQEANSQLKRDIEYLRESLQKRDKQIAEIQAILARAGILKPESGPVSPGQPQPQPQP